MYERAMRTLGTALVCLSVTLVCTSAWLTGPDHAIWVAIYLAVLLIPFFLQGADPLEPATAYAIFALAGALTKRLPVLLWGLEGHSGIAPDPYRLSALVREYLQIETLAAISVCVGARVCRTLVPVHRFEWQAQHAWPAAFLLLGIAGACLSTLIAEAGGLTNHLVRIAIGFAGQRALGESSSTLLIQIATWGAIGAIALAHARPTCVFSLRFLLFLSSSLIASWAAAGRRSAAILPLCLLAFVCFGRGVRLRLSFLAAGALIAILVFSAGAAFRRSGGEEVFTERELTEVIVLGMEEVFLRGGEESAIFALFDQVPERMPFLLGESYAGIAYAFVPRSLWPDKPRGIDYRAGSQLLGADWGTPVGAVGEAYWNFGIPGVVLVFLVYGAMSRWLYLYSAFGRQASPIGLAYLLYLFYFTPSQSGANAMLGVFLPLAAFSLLAWRPISQR